MLPKQNVTEKYKKPKQNVTEKTLLTLLTVMLVLMSTMMKKMNETPMETNHECRDKKTKKSFAMISLTLCYLKSKIRNRLKIAHQWVMNLLMEFE
jgi:hypothetical protein